MAAPPVAQAALAAERQPSRIDTAWQVLAGVPDPELPAISICDLGIVREVTELSDEGVALRVVLTPTYSGCPATEIIQAHARQALEAAGLGPVQISQRLAPAWTTDWISEAGRRKLLAYGIAPPGPAVAADPSMPQPVVMHWHAHAHGHKHGRAPSLYCPRCGSADTEQLSAFGSTACKSLYRCRACREPFEHFKPL